MVPTLFASWVRLFREERAFEINSWLYILGTNWAAGDLLINLRELSDLREAGAEDWMRDCATIGAAYAVVFWGLLHAICQTAVCFGVWGLARRQRLITLVIGALLPASSLTVALFVLNILEMGGPSEMADFVPAFYWDSQDSVHVTLMFGASTFGVWCLNIVLSYVFIIIWVILLELTKRNYAARIWQAVVSCYWICFLILIYLTLMGLNSLFWVWIPYVPVLSILFLGVWPVFVGSLMVILSAVYVVIGYFVRSISLSHSCFFMPCAPQSITENDQAFALLVAIFTFIAMEVGEPLYQRIQENRRTRLRFQQDTERDFELARMTRMAGNEDNFAEVSTEASEADASGSSIRSPSRINSGIAAEEGRVGLGFARRVRSDLQAQATQEGLVDS